MENPVRTVLVGLGARGKKWARVLQDEEQCDVVGFVDLSEENLEWVRTTYETGPEKCYQNMEQALDETKPTLVVLATPPMDRFRQVMSVFEHGSHLLSEKPLSLDFDEGVRMVKAAEDAKLAFAVGLNLRYQHCVLKARDILRSRVIGGPRFGGYTYWRNRDGYSPDLNRFPLSMRQPLLYEQTIHHIDEIRFVYDAEVERVHSKCWNPPWSMYRDDSTVMATFEMEGELPVNYFGTWSGHTKIDQFLWRTDCDDGALFQYEFFEDLRIVRGSEGDTMEQVPLPKQELLVDDTRAMVSQYLTSLSDGDLAPEPNAKEHLKTFGIIAACEESNKTGQTVEMAEFFQKHNVPQDWF